MEHDIHTLAQVGDFERLEAELEKDASPERIEAQKIRGTPLHFAVINNKMKCLNLLISKGGNVNAQNCIGETPLYIASMKGFLPLVKHLLYSTDALSGINVPNNAGFTPLYGACFKGKIDTVAELIHAGANIETDESQRKDDDHDDHDDLLMMVIFKGEVEIALMLINLLSATTLHRKNSAGYTILHAAAFKGCVELCEAFIDKGVNIEERNNEGYTALHMACYFDHLDVAKFLIDRGCNLLVKSYSVGNTPLHLTCAHTLDNVKDIIEALLKAGVNPNVRNDYGDAPLHIACMHGQIEGVTSLLRDSAANVNELNDAGASPMYLACISGYLDIMV